MAFVQLTELVKNYFRFLQKKERKSRALSGIVIKTELLSEEFNVHL